MSVLSAGTAGSSAAGDRQDENAAIRVAARSPAIDRSDWTTPNSARLDVMIAGGIWSSCRIENAVTLFPQPDSPTRASICRRPMRNETSSTALTRPSSLSNHVRRFRTRRRMSSASGMGEVYEAIGQ